MYDNRLEESTEQRVLIFPAPAFAGSGGRVHFLFSLSQVEDILKKASVYPVPFSPPYVEGIAEWRNRVVPVLSLEKCLGLAVKNTNEDIRMIMIRSAEQTDSGITEKRGMLKVDSAIRIETLPIPCAPISSVAWIPRWNMVRGVYTWDDGYLVVVNIGNILSGV